MLSRGVLVCVSHLISTHPRPQRTATVIRAADAAGLYDISGVQHYTDHGHKVVFLHARPQKSK